MDSAKKLAFIANMTANALQHVAATPDAMSPKGEMSHDKRLAFVQAMTKHGLKTFDVGGPTTVGGPVATVNNTGFGGSIGNALGLNNQFQAQATPIQAGTTGQELNTAYSGAQNAIGQQQGLASTLTPGVGQGAASQAQLNQMLMNEAQGQGPNPAQAALNQATGQNVANQAALMAGQRGTGANAGLLAREAAQQGAATQQQAVGQGATLQAQQQLAAQNNLQNLAATQVGQGQQAIQGINNAQQNEQNILQGANTAANNANVAMQGNLNNVNAQISTANQANQTGILGGIFNGIGSATGLFHDGGMVHAPKMMAAGGLMAAPTSGPQSALGSWITSNSNYGSPVVPGVSINTNPPNFLPKSDKASKPAKTPETPITPEQLGAQDSQVDVASDASLGVGGLQNTTGMAGGPMDTALQGVDIGFDAAHGGKAKAKAPTQKAVAAGDNLKNDKIPALLSEGEEVIDRQTLADPGPIGQMARAVAAHINKRNKMKGKA